MPPDDSAYPGDWLRIAEKDLKRVQVHLEANDPEAAGFFLPRQDRPWPLDVDYILVVC